MWSVSPFLIARVTRLRTKKPEKENFRETIGLQNSENFIRMHFDFQLRTRRRHRGFSRSREARSGAHYSTVWPARCDGRPDSAKFAVNSGVVPSRSSR